MSGDLSNDTKIIFNAIKILQIYSRIYCVAPQKIGTIVWYALTLPNINRFSQLFHCQK